MKNESKWIAGAMLVGVIIYLLSPTFNSLSPSPTNWELQTQFMYLSGICSLSLMITSMLISLRLPKINSLMGGLDKAYVVHKWVGIFTSAFVFFHWLGDKIPLLLIKLSVILDPRLQVDITQYSKAEIISYQLGLTLTEVFFYVLSLLVFISLYNKIPYRLFRKTHKYIPAIFLIFAFHGATVPMKEHWYKYNGIYPLLLLITIGCVISFIALFQQIGKSHKIKTTIKSIENKNRILDILLHPVNKPLVHQAGQFAFLQFEHSKEPHPFTIASSGDNPNELRFAIKNLGDYTKELDSHLKVGQHVIVEAPYGEFKFEDNHERQVWIAGGIGITPFLAQLEHLSNHGGTDKQIDFWYCTRGDLELQFPSSLQELCNKSGVRLHHLNSSKNEYITVDILKATIGNFNNVSIWFCGPVGLKNELKGKLKSSGFDLSYFHYENFSMR